MNNCALVIPNNVENLQLPDPSLLNFYKDLANRTNCIAHEINEH